jgi:hypothetical protein
LHRGVQVELALLHQPHHRGAVNVLVVEAIRKRVSPSTCWGLSRLVTPQPRMYPVPGCRRPRPRPGCRTLACRLGDLGVQFAQERVDVAAAIVAGGAWRRSFGLGRCRGAQGPSGGRGGNAPRGRPPGHAPGELLRLLWIRRFPPVLRPSPKKWCMKKRPRLPASRRV